MTCKGKGARKFAPVTMEKSSPLTPKSQPRWGHYPILPSPITRGNAASTNTLTASSGSTSQKVPTSLFCPMPMSKGSRTNSTLAPERYSATKPLARFSSAPEICPLHFTVEWAAFARSYRGRTDKSAVRRRCSGPPAPRTSRASRSIEEGIRLERSQSLRPTRLA